jgi:hypothetical protein
MAKKTMSDPWRTESDARTLIEYMEICSDKSRLTAAQKVLKEQAKNIDKALGSKKPSPKRSSSSKKSYI